MFANYLPLIILVAVILAGIIIIYFLLGRRRGVETLDIKVLSIRIPRGNKDEGDKNFLQQINLSEQLLGSLTSISRPIVFEASVQNTGEEIHFYLGVPRAQIEFAQKQIQGFFLDAKVEEAADYTIFDPNSYVSAGYLTQGRHFVLPISTYKESEADLFSPILSTLSKLQNQGEGASVQFVIKPLRDGLKKDAQKIFEKLREGKSFSELTKKGFEMKDIGQAVISEVNGNSEKKDDKPKVVDEEMVKATQLKLSKNMLNVNVRIVSAAQTKDRSEDIFLAISNAFTKTASPNRNAFKVIKPRNIKKIIFSYIFREFDDNQSVILNTEELASIFHLPTSSSDVPNVTWLKSKEAAPPEIIPTEGLEIGKSVFRGVEKTIKITDEDRRRHQYIIGQTGTGKSVLIQNLAMQDMRNGKGFCVIDPHGDLIDKILMFVPRERIDDVIVFDPGDRSRPMGLNMLEYNLNHPEEKTFIVNELQAIFNQLFDKTSMGPQFEKYMRNTLMLLMDDAADDPPTLMEVSRVFTDEEFRKRKLEKCKTPLVIDFWTKEVPKTTGEQSLGNFSPYITSKFDGFISNDYLRPIIGQPKSAFNFRQAMDEGKIILVNLSKGKIGDINSALLGMIIVGKLLQGALSRIDIIDEKARRDFYLYIDEFQNYTTDSIATILSEARKYRLNLVIAHQFIAQLKDNIRDAVFGNVGNLIALRVGPSDADVLVKQFGPVFNERDLISIENLNAYAKILVNGEPTLPFNFKFTWASGGSKDVCEQMKELSRLKYGCDLQDVEANIISRLRN